MLGPALDIVHVFGLYKPERTSFWYRNSSSVAAQATNAVSIMQGSSQVR
jgi:hypothetical protein